MKNIYLLSNNLVSNVNVIYPNDTTFNDAREKTMLSLTGEEIARKISNTDYFSNTEVIYSSPFFCSLDTSKYIAHKYGLDIILDNRLKERVVGELGCNEYRYLKGMQEHDFNYKLAQGESLNEVKERMTLFLKEVLKSDYNNILVVSHNIALLSLALKWCSKDYSLDDRLILNYKDNIIFDGSFNKYDLIKVEFQDNKLINIERIDNL
jgi:2,3-bisphosphoglycerate-dependent phosphoglycerate mutase